MLGELEDRAGGAVGRVRDARRRAPSTSLLRRAPDAHRAGLDGREDRDVAELGGAEPAGRLAEGDDDRVGGRVVGLADAVVGPGDHRVVDDGDGRARTLAARRWPARASASASPMNSS